MVKIGVKGELTSTQIATIVLVLIGFAIAALFIWALFFENEDLSERELCRLSVLSRATVPSVAEQAVPLNCFTEKVCITVDKGGILGFGAKDNSCKQFAGEENVRNVEVDLDNPIKAAEIIQRETANVMYDCWMMMGQGKMDIFSGTNGGIGEGAGKKLLDWSLDWASLDMQEIKPTCLVCSRIAFSDVLTTNDKWKNTAEYIDYNRFLSQSKVPNSAKTYIQAFTDDSVGGGYGVIEQSENKLAPYIKRFNEKGTLEQSDVAPIKEILIEQAKGNQSQIDKINKYELDTINKLFAELKKSTSSNQIAIVFTQIKVPGVDPKEQFWASFANGAVLGGVSAFSTPGKVASFLLPGPGWLKLLYKVVSVGAVSTVLAYNAESTALENQALSATTCGKFESTKKDAQNGCSLVKLMNWNVNEINGLCTGGIEGNL